MAVEKGKTINKISPSCPKGNNVNSRGFQLAFIRVVAIVMISTLQRVEHFFVGSKINQEAFSLLLKRLR